MADRTISVLFKGNVSGLVNSYKAVDKAGRDWANNFAKNIQNNEQHINSLSRTLGVAGAGLVGFAVLAVKRFADFDAAMSSVQAATMETAGNMELLRVAALEAGKETVYSATESADAVEQLAKAGVSTADILGGGLKGALDLAASGSLAVGDAAEYAASAMTQFGLDGKDVPHIADLLAAAAGKAQGDVQDFGAALSQTGLVANQTGLTIEETTAGLAAFASAGLIGSDAGTSFKSMLQRLTPQSNEARQKMEELGISAYDAQGNFIGLADFAGNLQDSLRDLTPEQRNAAMATIFGSDAVRAASVIYEQGAEGIREWEAAVNDQGFASEQAAIRLDNLKGDIEQLGGAFETALIGMGEGANGPLREIVQTLTGVVDGFSEMSEGAQQATLALAGAGGLSALGVAGLGKVVVGISEAKEALNALKISGRTAGIALGVIGGALAIGSYYLSEWAGNAQRAKGDTEDFASSLDETTGAITDSTAELVAQKVASAEASRIYRNLGGDVGDLTGYVLGNADAIERVNTLLEEQPKESFFGIESDTSGVAQVKEDLDSLTGSLEDSRTAWETEQQALEGVEGAAGSLSPAVDELASATAGAAAETNSYQEALYGVVDAMLEASNTALQGRDAQRDFESAIDGAADALKENGATLDITTEKGRENEAALDAIANAGLALIDNNKQQGASQTELQGIMQGTRDRFVEAAQAFGLSGDEANALADKLNLIPSQVTARVDADTQSAWQKVDDFVWQNNGRTINLHTTLDESGFWAGLSNIKNANTGSVRKQADGGVMQFYADGGENHTAQIAPAGSWRVWAEPETGGEAYIPLALSKRARSENILSDVANRFGGTFQKFDDGGFSSRQYTMSSVPSAMVSSSARGGGGASFFSGASIVAANPQEAIKELRALVRQEMAGMVFG